MNSSTSTQLSNNKINIYKPIFDLETGKYIDESPILPRQTTIEFKCLCNQKTFNTVTKYKSHIALKGHQRYVACYLDHLQDIDEVKEEMTRLRTKYELNERKLKTQLKAMEDKLKHTEAQLYFQQFQPFQTQSAQPVQQMVQPMTLD
jgi:hypothetical protein